MFKKLATIILPAFCFSILTYSQAPAIEWQYCYGGIASDVAYCVAKTSDGGSVVCGSTYSTVLGNSEDIRVVKLDASGTILWQKDLGGNEADRGLNIEQTADGGYIIAGFTFSNNTGDVGSNHGISSDYWIVKLTSTGVISWQKNFGGTGIDEAHGVHQTSDGGYIVGGKTSSLDGDVTGNHGGTDVWILKLDAAGNIEWKRSYGGTANDIGVSGITQTIDGGYIFSGAVISNDGDVINPGNVIGIAWFVKLDVAGNIEWQKVYGSNSGGEASYGLCKTSDGGYAATGLCYANSGNVTGNHGNTDFWIIKMDNVGNLLWQRSFGGSSLDEVRDIIESTDGSIVVAGWTLSTNGDVTGNQGGQDYWVVKVSATGSLLWQKILGGTGHEQGWGICQTNDGAYIIAGYTGSDNTGDVGPNHSSAGDMWVVKLVSELVPVTLTHFDAVAKGKDVVCSWQTQQEQNSDHFIVERSDDGIHFYSKGTIAAAGNSALPLTYNYTDQNALLSGKEYLFYRLKMVDTDGSFTYSPTARVRLEFAFILTIYPNPAEDQLHISFVSAAKEQATLSVYNDAGVKVYQELITLIPGNNLINLDIRTFPAGAYTLRLNGQKNYGQRFIKT